MPVIAIVLGLAIIFVGSYLLINKDDSEDNTAVVRQEEAITTEVIPDHNTTTSAESPIIQTTKTYTDEVTYRMSDNLYIIDVTLEVSDGVVKSADAMYGNKETGYQHPLQERFDAVYKTEVIGKKLEDINLSRVGGASLTSKAFNEAVADIIKQANT